MKSTIVRIFPEPTESGSWSTSVGPTDVPISELSVSIVAALIVLADPKDDLVLVLATVAVALVFTNIVSGFGITERILRLFRQRKGTK